jgi:histidyl-tRNA synthetase
MTPVQPVRGTQSLLGEDADRLAAVVSAFDRVRKLYGFQRVEVPTIEQMSVFARTIGETTDVVSKEMYSFKDKGDEWLALRPEFTAGISRAYLSEGWQRHIPLKVATHGSAFRYERPQKGRHREFHQLDAEIIGAEGPLADVELLVMGDHLLRELGIREQVQLQLNTLGDAASRDAWRDALIQYFSEHESELSEDCLQRLHRNPLRILDSKDTRDARVAANAPSIDSYLSTEAAEFLAQVEDGLVAAGVDYQRNAKLVRGLDYYRHTAFEFVTNQLGAQGAVIAGGRYDGLIETLGGPHTPAVGWAAGIERLGLMIDAPKGEPPELVLIPEERADDDLPVKLLRILRDNGIRAELGFSGSPNKRYEKAKKGPALRALTVATWGVPGVGRLRIRNLKADVPPVRTRLKNALSQHYVLREEEDRSFTLVNEL